MPRLFVPATAAMLCLLATCLVSRAADQRAGDIERVYDVRDLAIDIPDFKDAPALGIEPSQPPAAPAPTDDSKPRQALTRDVIALLKQVVRPEDLADATLVAERDGQMYLRGRPAAHDAIAAALDELRRRRMTQVTLQAWLVRPDAEAIERITKASPALARKLHMAAFRGGDREGTELTEAEWQSLRRAPGPVGVPRMTVYTGQSAYVLTATQRAFVERVDRRVGADGAETFEPVIGTVASGVVLSGRATAARDLKSAAVDARVSLATLHGMTNVAVAGVPRRPDLMVQVPDVETETFDVNAVAPSEGLLLFGVTESKRPNPVAPALGDQDDHPLYLVLSATVVAPKTPQAVH